MILNLYIRLTKTHRHLFTSCWCLCRWRVYMHFIHSNCFLLIFMTISKLMTYNQIRSNSNRRMPRMEQELLILPVHLSLPSVLVARSLVFYVVLYILLFIHLSFGYCFICSYFWLPLCYLQTFHVNIFNRIHILQHSIFSLTMTGLTCSTLRINIHCLNI
jgi:hypothetical protein